MGISQQPSTFSLDGDDDDADGQILKVQRSGDLYVKLQSSSFSVEDLLNEKSDNEIYDKKVNITVIIQVRKIKQTLTQTRKASICTVAVQMRPKRNTKRNQ